MNIKNILILTVTGLFLINLISGLDVNISSGENYSITLPESYSYYVIEGNSSSLEEYINVTSNGNVVNIGISKYMPTTSFSITFYNSKGEAVGGGSGSSVYKRIEITPKYYYPNCDEGKSKCVGSDLWYCENGEWKSTKCDYDCEDGVCIEEEKPETNKTNNSIWIILLMLIGLILLVVFCIISFKKRHMPNGTERRIKENETKINGQES